MPIGVLVGLLVMLIVLGLFATLKVAVGDGMIKIQFGMGVIRKGFLLKEIEAYRVVRNPWYYGWGIRYTPQGWLYTVSSFSAIELQMKSGKKYRIGTDDPEGLAKAIDQALSDTPVHFAYGIVCEVKLLNFSFWTNFGLNMA